MKNTYYIIVTATIIIKFFLLAYLDIFAQSRKAYHLINATQDYSTFQGVLSLQKEWIQILTQNQTNIAIFSSWRSGSSFMGGIFEASSLVMYIYEPFHDFGSKIIRYTHK